MAGVFIIAQAAGKMASKKIVATSVPRNSPQQKKRYPQQKRTLYQKGKKKFQGFVNTLPETNIAPENRPSQKDPKGNSSFNHQFSGAMLVSGRVS